MSKAAELAALIGSGQAQGNKNLIINGAMQVSQRGTSAVTIADAAQYRVDRFNAYDNTSGAFTYEQSTTTPSGEGFINSTKLTVTSADTSIAAGEYAYCAQYIEGTNFSQCDFGNSGAKSVTLSFFVRSSATGTYCVTLANSASNRSFVSEYTISSANTWEKKTITVAGDTTGTWLTTTGIGLKVFFCLAVGSTYQQSAGSWGTTSFAFGSSNQTNWLGTNGNTLYITGVQLEIGDVATPFEHRRFDDEWHSCQRYCTVYNIGGGNTHGQNLVSSNNTVPGGGGHNDVANRAEWFMSYPVKRSQPTITVTDPTNMRWLADNNAVQDGTSTVTFPVGTGHQTADAFQSVTSLPITEVIVGWIYKGSGTYPVITIDSEL